MNEMMWQNKYEAVELARPIFGRASNSKKGKSITVIYLIRNQEMSE